MLNSDNIFSMVWLRLQPDSPGFYVIVVAGIVVMLIVTIVLVVQSRQKKEAAALRVDLFDSPDFQPTVALISGKYKTAVAVDFRRDRVKVIYGQRSGMFDRSEIQECVLINDCHLVGEHVGGRQLLATALFGVAGRLITKEYGGVVGEVKMEIVIGGTTYSFDVAEASQTQTSDPFPPWQYESIIQGVLTLQALFGGIMKLRGTAVEEQLYTKATKAGSPGHRVVPKTRGEEIICPKCGFDQWKGYSECQKCGAPFKATEEPNEFTELSLTADSPVIRKRAAERAKGPESISALVQAFDNESVWYVRSAIISALQKIGGQEAAAKVAQYRESFLVAKGRCRQCSSFRKFYDWGYSGLQAWRCSACESPNDPVVIEVDFSVRISGAESPSSATHADENS